MTPAPALVVEPGLTDVLLLVPVLSVLGFQVTTAETFQDAKQSLQHPPRLLITDIRLGAFNGLHLVMRARSVRPDVAAIVTSDIDDPVLRADAEAMGATFMVKPLNAVDLRAAVARTVLRAAGQPIEAIRAPFERRLKARRVESGGASGISERRVGDRRADVLSRFSDLHLN